MGKWCSTQDASAASLTAAARTGSWSATVCRCTSSSNKQRVAGVLNDLSFRLGCRAIDGFAERAVYREFFPCGLTALDDLDQAMPGTRPNAGHIAARKEVTSLLSQLKLPLDERGRRRVANRAEWFAQVDTPLKTFDIIDA